MRVTLDIKTPRPGKVRSVRGGALVSGPLEMDHGGERVEAGDGTCVLTERMCAHRKMLRLINDILIGINAPDALILGSWMGPYCIAMASAGQRTVMGWNGWDVTADGANQQRHATAEESDSSALSTLRRGGMARTCACVCPRVSKTAASNVGQEERPDPVTHYRTSRGLACTSLGANHILRRPSFAHLHSLMQCNA